MVNHRSSEMTASPTYSPSTMPTLKSVADRPPTPDPRAMTHADVSDGGDPTSLRLCIPLRPNAEPMRVEKSYPVSIDPLSSGESESEEEGELPAAAPKWDASLALHELMTAAVTPIVSIHDHRLAGQPYSIPLKVAIVQASLTEHLLHETRMEAARGTRDRTFRVIRSLARTECELKRRAADALTRQHDKMARSLAL